MRAAPTWTSCQLADATSAAQLLAYCESVARFVRLLWLTADALEVGDRQHRRTWWASRAPSGLVVRVATRTRCGEYGLS